MIKHRAQPKNPLILPRFSGITSFSRLPVVEDPKKGALDLGILGVPWDGGTTFRTGARFGPRAIREASVLNRNYNPVLEVDIYGKNRVADLGDVLVNPLNLEITFKNIEEKLTSLHLKKINTICLGGDHSILLPILRSHKKAKNKNPVLVHFDAHTDTADQAWGEKYHHGTPIRRAIEEGLVKGDKIFQIGIRGPLTSANQVKEADEMGIHVLTMEDFHDPKKKKSFIKKIFKVAGREPVYITFDVDGVDPAFAPGTGTPVVGGLTSYEALSMLRALSGLNVIGGDVVEVCPPYDHAQMTSLLAAAVAFEMMSLISV